MRRDEDHIRPAVILSCAAALMHAGCAFGPTREEIAAKDNSMSYDMGAKNSAPEFAQCRMAQLQQREANAALAVNFQEVVHSAPAVNADVTKHTGDSRRTEWTPTRMLL
jgi:hypothetical protein